MIESIIHRPVGVAMAYAAIIVCGACALWRLPLDLAPDVEHPALSIRTSWPGVSAETVEKCVTAPIEEMAGTVAGVRKVSSVSSEGGSQVDIECDRHARMDLLRLELNEKLDVLARSFPAGVDPPVTEPFVPADLRELQGFISYAIAGERGPAELRALGCDVLAPRLRGVEGVADAQVVGGEERELRCELDAGKMAALGLRPDDVAAALGGLGYHTPAGAVAERTRRVTVSVHPGTLTADDAVHSPVGRTSSGRVIRLQDCGMVVSGSAETLEYFRINGRAAVTLVVSREPQSNTLRVAERVFARVEELRRALPDGVELLLESDKSALMRQELATLYRDILFSLVCITTVLIVFLGNVRAPILILSSIAFSLAGTFMIFWLLGIGLHLFSLAGLVLGFGRLVDDSIVVLDNIQRHSASGPDGSTVPRSVREIALPVIASTITTAGALVPVSFLPPHVKPYFIDFALAVGISLVMSLVVSFTLIPVAAARMRSLAIRPAVLDRIGEIGVRAYGRLLGVFLRHRRITASMVLWIFGFPVWLLPADLGTGGPVTDAYNAVFGSAWYTAARPWVNAILGGTSHLFFTKVNSGEIWSQGKDTYIIVRIVLPGGTDLERSDEIARKVESLALAFGNGVEKVTSRVAPGATYIRIAIPGSLERSDVPYLLKGELAMLASRTGGATIGVYGFGPGFSTGGESAPQFAVRVHGYDYAGVKAIAEQLRRRLERNPRIADVDIDRSWGAGGEHATELVARIDREQAARHGLAIGSVINAVRNSIPGALQSGTVHIGAEPMRYAVKIAGFRDRNVDDLRQAMVAGDNGEAVRMSALLTFDEQRTPSEILREDQSYLRWVTFEYRGPHRFGDVYIDDVIRSLTLPHGYRCDRSSSWFVFSARDGRLMLMIAGVSFLVVFMVTAALYESLRRPFFVILAVPFSLIGLFLAFYVTRTPFGRGGYAAVILLIGIVATNSIVLVDAIGRATAGRLPRAEEIVEAASRRLRPVLMTTLTTIGGLLPMIVLGDRSSIWFSLAVGTIGGLLSSTILTLLVIPARFSYRHADI